MILLNWAKTAVLQRLYLSMFRQRKIKKEVKLECFTVYSNVKYETKRFLIMREMYLAYQRKNIPRRKCDIKAVTHGMEGNGNAWLVALHCHTGLGPYSTCVLEVKSNENKKKTPQNMHTHVPGVKESKMIIQKTKKKLKHAYACPGVKKT